MQNPLYQEVMNGNRRALARAISAIENELPGFEQLLLNLPVNATPIIGITGPPGAGKSTITDGLIAEFIKQEKKIAVLCVDPSSPFNQGALLGDRIRMSNWYNDPSVFIRSLATRGSLGGLTPAIIEITDLVKAAGFDLVIVETVGVGQTEIEIAGLADLTMVVVVPEAGDEVQTMKAGLMEIADVFVVNKADRPGADQFVNNLRQMLAPAFRSHYEDIPIVKTIASQEGGLEELSRILSQQLKHYHNRDKKYWLLAEKAWQLIQKKRMEAVDREEFRKEIGNLVKKGDFHLYRFVQEKLKEIESNHLHTLPRK